MGILELIISIQFNLCDKKGVANTMKKDVNKNIGSIKKLLFGVLLITLLLCGCGKDASIERETIEVLDDNRIKCTFVEPFDTSLYELDELNQMMRTEIDAFNSQKGMNCVSVEDAIVKDTQNGEEAYVEMIFNDYKIFNEYNNRAIFVGSVVQAQIAGYDLVGNLVDGKGVPMEEEVLEKNKDRSVVVMDTPVVVHVPGKILYTGGACENIGSREVAFQESEQGLKAVLYK